MLNQSETVYNIRIGYDRSIIRSTLFGGRMSLLLQVEETQKRGAELKLHLGCGRNILAGWINTDGEPLPELDYLDVSRPLPFNDSTFSAVFCEHTIEHIDKISGIRLIAEVFRVLKSGGAVRFVTPSLDAFCRMALQPQSKEAETYLSFFRQYSKNEHAQIWDAFNLIFFGHGHHHVYMGQELGGVFQSVGFSSIKLMTAEVYGNPIFKEVDGHGKVVGKQINAIEAMAIEAIKP